MEKIDILNCLYHGIMSSELGGNPIYLDNRLQRLESILKTGQIYSINEQIKHGIRRTNPEDGLNPPDTICIACHPKSIHAPVYTKNRKEYLNGYIMSNSSFAFLLNPLLLSELSTSKGNFDFEILVKDQIPLQDYVLGMKNTGADLSRYFQIYDLLLSYLMGEIDETSYKNMLDRYFGIEASYFELNKQCNSDGQTFTEEAHERLMHESSLLEDEQLHQNIDRIIQKSEFSIPIYDTFGNPIESLENQKQKVKTLQQKSQNYFQK